MSTVYSSLVLFLIVQFASVQCRTANRELLGTNTVDCPAYLTSKWCACPWNNGGDSCQLNCDGKDVCKEYNLRCAYGEPCEINCKGDLNACSDAPLINAAPATDTVLNCLTKASCKTGTFVGGKGTLDINCLNEDCCQDSFYYGNSSTDMTVMCNTKAGCKNSIFVTGGCGFKMDCIAEDVCQDTRIYAQRSTDVDINCDSKAACKGSGLDDFVIEAGRCNFNLLCIGEDVCQDAHMDGQLSHDVTVLCNGLNSCKGSNEDNAWIICGSGNCHITCTEPTSCEDLNIDASRATNYKCTGFCPPDAPANDWGNTPSPPPTACYECDPTPQPTTPSPTTPSPTTPSPTTPSPTTPSPTTPSPTTPSPTTPSPTTPSPTTPSPTTPSPTTPSPTTPSPTTPSPTTPSPTTPSPTTPSPTTPSPVTTTAEPTISPTFVACQDFAALDSPRRADYILLSDMSLVDGSYNDVCDYYRRDEITVAAGSRLSGVNPDENPGQLRIGETMSLEFDLTVDTACGEGEAGCDVINIGTASDEHYPLIQITGEGRIQVTVSVFEGDGETITPVTLDPSDPVVNAGETGRIALLWTMSNVLVTYNDVTVIDEAVNGHKVDTTNFFTGADGEGHRIRMYASQSDTEPIEGVIKNLCIRTSHTPEYWKEIPTICQAKQNMVAEALTVLKGHDGLDQGNTEDDMKNVRYAYIEFDGDGAYLIRNLTADINYAPVSDADMLDEFTFIQERECGVGTDDDTNLCDAIELALDHFDESGNSDIDSFDPEREKKLLIVSNNKEITCDDGQDICEKFGKRLGGNGDNTFGVSTFMINVDTDGADNTYYPCLVNNEQSRIDDITTNECLLYEDPGGDDGRLDCREDVVGRINAKLCFNIPSPQPTTDPTRDPTTPSPTTPSPTTPSPTTPSPTTPSPTTPSPTTPSPTTPSPTTPSPTTPSPTTPSPTTPSPTTPSPTTPSPTTPSPTTPSPTTPSPTTPSPTTPSPTTPSPTTPSPTTPSPTTPSPTTPSPTTPSPTTPSPTTPSPTTPSPTTPSPTTPSPTTPSPTTPSPTTPSPTTPSPTTPSPTTPSPTTPSPTTPSPTTPSPTTPSPTTPSPTTPSPTTPSPTTPSPTTPSPTTPSPTTPSPTTPSPTTPSPTTPSPTTPSPTTPSPTTPSPTTPSPTTPSPTTPSPTTPSPTTPSPTTPSPTTPSPTTPSPTTPSPTTPSPTTPSPTTPSPTTPSPTTPSPTTPSPTTPSPTTPSPTTPSPTTPSPTTPSPTTPSPTTPSPTTPSPTTPSPTTPSPTTPSPTTPSPTTPSPTTPSPTTPSPTTPSPTTPSPTTPSPTTPSPTTPSPTTPSPTTPSPTTPSPTTPSPTTPSPTTPSPTTPSPTTPSPTTPSPTTPSPTTPSPTTPSPTTPSPTTPSPTTPSPTTPSPTTPSPTTPSPTTPSPTTPSPTTPSPTTPSPTTPSPTTPSPTTSSPPTPCPTSNLIDLVILNDISCAMSVDECKETHQEIADWFSFIRTTATTLVRSSKGEKDYFKVRVAFVEFDTENDDTTLNTQTHVDFWSARHNDDLLRWNLGSTKSTPAEPTFTETRKQEINDAYHDWFITRGDEVCDATLLDARQGNPALADGLSTAIEFLFRDSGSENLLRDKEILIFSSCAYYNRTDICNKYYEEIRNHGGLNAGINVNMVNKVPNAPNTPSGTDDMVDPEYYLSCLTEYDPETRIHVIDGTNDITPALADSLCKAPTPTPTTDPTIDPTRDPVQAAAFGEIEKLIEPIMAGLSSGADGTEDSVITWYTSYSLWIFAGIVCVFSVNVVLCCCIQMFCGEKKTPKWNNYGFISNKIFVVDSDEDTESEPVESDVDLDQLL